MGESKPADWVDDEEMDDPDATKPDDWDDEEDGEWQAPQIDNPEYKGEWKPDRIDNPDYVEAKDVQRRGPVGYIGVEVWQVKAGTVFSDFILTDSVEEAEVFLNSRKTNIDDEKAAKEAYDEANKPAEEE